MIYSSFQDKQLSLLGFGAMRLPTKDGLIDEGQVSDMVRLAMEKGVNYFDTAWPYHGGMSEIVMGKILNQYPRGSWYLANKYPGHQIAATYNPADIFEQQLKKCGVDYFDFYLLHNVYENSMNVYLDPKWGIIDYFKEQKRLGRIKHLGFSTHGSVETIRAFLDAAGEDMEFCQIQLNYLDWTLQKAKEKVELLNERNIPVWVMEPVRGGRLCNLNEQENAVLSSLRPDEKAPAWAFRFLQEVKGVSMILSGMSNMDQMADNLNTFENRRPLTDEENTALLQLAEGMKNSIPCTACKYCTPHCPMGLDIPHMISTLNDLNFLPSTNTAMWVEFLPEEKKPDACIGCGACAAICPQKIDIPGAMSALAEKMKTIPSWAKICKEREEAARKLAGK